MSKSSQFIFFGNSEMRIKTGWDGNFFHLFFMSCWWSFFYNWISGLQIIALQRLKLETRLLKEILLSSCKCEQEIDISFIDIVFNTEDVYKRNMVLKCALRLLFDKKARVSHSYIRFINLYNKPQLWSNFTKAGYNTRSLIGIRRNK